MKKIILILTATILFSNFSYAEKVECNLLSPIQKAIYKAYCAAEAKKKMTTTSSDREKLSDNKTLKAAKKILGTGNTDSTLLKTGKYGDGNKLFKVNTDSKLFRTGKYSKKK